MKKQIFLLLFVLIVFSDYIDGQDFKFSNAKPSISKFYDYIYQDPSKPTSDLVKIFENSNIAQQFKEIKKQYFAELTQKLDTKSLKIVIENIRIHYDGDINTQYAILSFPNKKNIYFELNADSIFLDNYPAKIEDIFLSNGNSILSFDTNNVPEKLLFLGLINPKRNKLSAKIYRSPDMKSISEKEIKINQLFYFSPNDSEWYSIFSYQDQKPIGFIKKYNIITFEDFPKSIVDKIQNRNF